LAVERNDIGNGGWKRGSIGACADAGTHESGDPNDKDRRSEVPHIVLRLMPAYFDEHATSARMRCQREQTNGQRDKATVPSRNLEPWASLE
ncbi:MAG TPA: hypothetical protein VN860_05670, partial [Candidatus Acidoferrales bacterium]|nr:hypothetical protein [Candidatus Acidoferrales bacterium]